MAEDLDPALERQQQVGRGLGIDVGGDRAVGLSVLGARSACCRTQP
jgi:hypothetical protein